MKCFDLTMESLALLYIEVVMEFGDMIKDEGDKITFFKVKPKRKKELNEFLVDFCREHSDKLSQSVLTRISIENKDIFDFLREAYISKKENDRANLETIREIASDFDEEIAECLLGIYDIALWNLLPLKCDENGNLKVSCLKGTSYDKYLLLTNANILGSTDFRTVLSVELTKSTQGYILEFAVESLDGYSQLEIAFEQIKLIREFFNYTTCGSSMTHDDNQWITLANFLGQLESKYNEFGEAYLNAKEKELLPLTRFAPIMLFSGYFNFAENDTEDMTSFVSDEEGIALFEKYANEYSKYCKIPSLLSGLRKCRDEKSKRRASAKIQNALRQKESEPLWRALYNDLRAAASEYPLANVAEDEANATRNRIAEALRQQGFEGEYPCFKKLGALKGIRLFENRMSPSILVNEKHMASYIFCEESQLDSDRLEIDYICGTIFLRKDELGLFDQYDAYSTFFLDKDRRFGRVVKPQYPDFVDDVAIYVPDEEVAEVAAKIATLQKVTKEEGAKAIRLDYINVFAILAGFTVLGTLLFGLFMTIGFILITFILGLIFTSSLDRTMDAIAHLPWLYVFLGTGLPFGLIMGTISAFAQARK